MAITKDDMVILAGIYTRHRDTLKDIAPLTLHEPLDTLWREFADFFTIRMDHFDRKEFYKLTHSE